VEGAAQTPARSGTLGSQAMATITAAARTMYPHDALPDDIYARVGEKLAEAAREDSGVARMIEDGVSALNGGTRFAELSADEQLKRLQAIEGSDFFELVRSTAVVGLLRPAHLAAGRLRGTVLREGRLYRPGFQRPRLASRPGG